MSATARAAYSSVESDLPLATFPARLHILLARDAPVGVVFRRGPSKQVATYLWDRSTDRFTLGQWLKGRIYERRSDLSPDGKHLIYFAMNGKWDSETRGSWTAISRAPYLKAISLFRKGDCWNGGGLFLDNRSYWLNGAEYHTTLHDSRELLQRAKHGPSGNFGSECLGVYYPRLLRDGWTLIEQMALSKRDRVDLFEKSAGSGWMLQKRAHAGIETPDGKGCYWDEHRLVQVASGNVIKLPNWEWAEKDRDRLVWTERGRLYAGRLTEAGVVSQSLLRDFITDRFEAVAAPY